jgi:hypothetical protein
MTVHNPPGWLENAGATHTAHQLRSYVGGMFAGTNAVGTDLIPRGGINSALGAAYLVQAQASPNMSIRVGSGLCYVPGTESPTQGAYAVMNDAEVTLAVSAAHGSLSRIDSVVARVRDSDYSGSDNDALLQVVAGTPAGSPSAPTLPNNTLRLANITVGPAVSSITNPDIADTRRFAAALGGIMPVQAASNLASIGSSQVEPGQAAFAINGETLWLFTAGGGWRQVPLGPTGDAGRIYVSKSADTPRTSTSQSDDPHLQANSLPANATYKFWVNLIVSAVAVGQGDFVLRFSHPGAGGAYVALTKQSLFHAATTATSDQMDDEAIARTTATPTGELSAGVGATPSGIQVEGKLFTGSGGGNFRLQWRLLTAVGTTTLRQESDMLLERMS